MIVRSDARAAGLVYLVQNRVTLNVKVGWTAGGVERRLSELQTGSDCELVVLATRPGTRADERALHRQLEEWRIRGEWFKPAPAVLGCLRGPIVDPRMERRPGGRTGRYPTRAHNPWRDVFRPLSPEERAEYEDCGALRRFCDKAFRGGVQSLQRLLADGRLTKPSDIRKAERLVALAEEPTPSLWPDLQAPARSA